MNKININDFKLLLSDATKKIDSTDDPIKINTIAEALICELTESEYASLWIFDEQEALLRRYRSDSYVNELSMLDQRGILAKTFLTMSGGIYNYLASEKEYLPAIDNPDDIRMKSKILIPLIDGERFLGIATAYNSVRHIKNFNEDDMEILEAAVPFFNSVIYRICPSKQTEARQEVYLSERMKQGSAAITEKIETIQKERQEQTPPDAMLTFLSNTVHDIRTPANALYGFLELLEGQIDQPRLVQYIQNAKESARFINELTTSILDRVSAQRERQESKPVQIAPAKFFADIAEIFSANMSDKQIQYNIYIDPLIPKEITIDAVKLKRVVLNLIGNAYKFTPAKHSVEFSVQYDPSASRLLLAVADTGIGIAEESQKRIFEAFSQAEDDTAAKFGGTGLGLAISAQYVRELGGELQLESELEKGSRFHFSLPLHIDNSAPTFAPVNTSGIHIALLLDDANVAAARNLMRYLMRMGIAKSAVSAVKSVVQAPSKTTHIIVFQSKLQTSVRAFAEQEHLPILVMEEAFMSMANEQDTQINIASQYGYYADSLHGLFSAKTAARVLIADDDRINIELLKAILEDEFCHIEIAQDGEKALQLLKKGYGEHTPFAVAFLDKHMPKVSGDDLLRQIRAYEQQQPDARKLYAVSISGDPRQDTMDKTLYNGYVGKPFNKKKIQEMLKTALRQV
jgi:two-component system sensor histidine kinase BarA